MRWVFLAFVLSLSACQSWDTRNADSLYYRIPAGSTLTLSKDLNIPAGNAAVYIQNGQIAASSGQMRGYDAHCILEMRAIKDVAQPVKADQFVILKVAQETRLARADFILLAMNSHNTMIAGKNNDGGPSQKLHSTLLDLRSERQPEVFRLTCQRWDDRSYNATPLTVSEIRKTLSDVFTLKLSGT
jgi:hypothetical protein